MVSFTVSSIPTFIVAEVSNISVRLVPPFPDVYFFGRVEVFHDGEWGTICDDLFRVEEAHVICSALNYERALCALSNARYGPGSGNLPYVYE